jgi:hypothetical protein
MARTVGTIWSGDETHALLRSYCLASALIDPPRQVLVTRRDPVHHLLDFRVVRVCCSVQDFPGAISQLIREQQKLLGNTHSVRSQAGVRPVSQRTNAH